MAEVLVDYTAFQAPVQDPERYCKLSMLQLYIEFPLYEVTDIRSIFRLNGSRYIPTYICLVRNTKSLRIKTFKNHTTLHPSHLPKPDSQVDDNFAREREWVCINRLELGATSQDGIGACPAIERALVYNSFAWQQLFADAPYLGEAEVKNLLQEHHGSYAHAFLDLISRQLEARAGTIKVALEPVAPFLRPLPRFTGPGADDFVKELMWTRVNWLTLLPNHILMPRPITIRSPIQGAMLSAINEQLSLPSPVGDVIPDLPFNLFTAPEPTPDDWLGKGASGEVFRMTAPQFGGLVAVKVQRLLTGEDSTAFKDNVFKEWRVHQRLDHPNIIKFYDCFKKDEGRTIFFVIELMDFGSVQTLVSCRNAASSEPATLHPVIPECCIAWICKEVCCGLEFVHRLGLRHGDIKAGNILLNTAGRVKLCDLGHTGRAAFGWPVTGTTEYWPPEAMLDERQRDVWALGIVIRYMVTGGLPPRRVVKELASMYAHLFTMKDRGEKKRHLHQLGIATTPVRLLLPAYPSLSADMREFMGSTLENVPAGRLTTAALLELPFLRGANAREELAKLIVGDPRGMHESKSAQPADAAHLLELASEVENAGPRAAEEQALEARRIMTAAGAMVSSHGHRGLSSPCDAFDAESTCLKIPGAFPIAYGDVEDASIVRNINWDYVVLSIVIFFLSASRDV